MSASRPSFRPDLEGLRGAAILLVVLYHAGVPGLSGGFVGVDVFFVLSGFFITGLLAREAAATGTVDLAGFYGRRALRLLPPLLVVLTATLALVGWLYAPIDRAAVMATGRAVALSSSNAAFARGAVDYFTAGEDPLLHTWSLAVEQQFYLVWPLLVLALALAVPRRAGDDGTGAPRGLLAGVAALGGLSFAACLWMTRAGSPWAFYGSATRLWEFALGGALALVPDLVANVRRGAGTALQAAGLAAVAAAVVAYDRSTPYPGLAALLPALGAAALVAGGAGDGACVLAAPPLRWLGRVSYAWYLWHWPLVALGAVLDPGIGAPGRLAWSAAALGLAWLTYAVVEGSARDGRLARVPERRLPWLAFAATALAALGAQGGQWAAERRAARPDQRAFAAAREDRMAHECWARNGRPAPGPCAFGDTASPVTVALLGDSHAEHWLAGLDRVGRERGWKVVVMVNGGCPVSDAPELVSGRRAERARLCAGFREAMVRRILATRPAAVILSSWDYYVLTGGGPAEGRVTADAWGRGLRRTYARLSAAGIPVVAFRGTPRTGFDVPSCLSRRAAGLAFAGDCTYARDGALLRSAAAAQTAAARGLRVALVDMNDQICAAPRCATVRNGVVVFTDDNHLTASFTRSLAPVLDVRLRAAFGRLGARLP